MPNWKKVITSGSDAALNTLLVTNGITGSLLGTASYADYATSASYALNGGVTQLLAGPNVILSPTNGLGQVTVTATLSGSNSYNTSTGSYGSFYDTTTQTNPIANIARSMSFNSTDITNGVSISGSTSPFNTYIKTENAGVYDIQFSAQVDKTDSGTDEIVIWLRKNGTDLTDSATTLTLNGNNDKQVAAWNWFVSSATGDYYQIIWRSPDTDLRLLAEPISVDHPGIPSVIATVNRVDQFLSNTGSFSGSFTGVFTGSLLGTASYATQALSSSYALTASYALSASYAPPTPPFPFTGSALITGSLGITGSLSVINSAVNVPAIVARGGGGSGNVISVQTTAGTQIVGIGFTGTTGIIENGNSLPLRLSATNADLIMWNNGIGNLTFTTNGSEKGKIFNNGNFYLGTTPTDFGYKLDVSGSARIRGAVNTSISSSLVVYGSGSAQPVFTVQGSQGELFSVTDSLSGSLFSVNDISGLPIMEVFSDNTTLIGSYQAPSLNTTVKTTTAVGNNVIYSVPTASYNGAWFEYVATSASNARAGQIMSVCSSNTITYTETTTTDIGSTTGLNFMVMITGSNFALTGSSTTAGWTIKTIVRGI